MVTAQPWETKLGAYGFPWLCSYEYYYSEIYFCHVVGSRWGRGH